MFRLILKITGWVLLAGFMGGSVWFTNRELKNVKCQSVSVHILDGSPRFLQEDDILELVKKTDNSIFGKQMKSINTEVLEKKIREVESIRNAEVYRRIGGKSLQFTGKLVIEIEERNPIVRIKTDASDYYLDREGMMIPVSRKFSSRVLVISGVVTPEIAKNELLSFAEFVYADPFWKAQIEQINVQKNKELLVITRVGSQLVEFGTIENYQEKLRNLKAVYQQGFSKTGWGKYKTINLKYKNQVVCTKS